MHYEKNDTNDRRHAAGGESRTVPPRRKCAAATALFETILVCFMRYEIMLLTVGIRILHGGAPYCTRDTAPGAGLRTPLRTTIQLKYLHLTFLMVVHSFPLMTVGL
jgi:hypothetical protein